MTTGRAWIAVALLVGLVAGVLLQRTSSPAPAADPASVFAAIHTTVVDIRVDAPESRLGAGVAVTPTEVITARHLVIDAEVVAVTTSMGETFDARVVGTDARTDLALLEVDGVIEPARLGSSRGVRVGDTVVAVGNPFGLSHSVSVGAVGATGRRLDRSAGPRVEFLQLAIPLNPGNSGGPIFDLGGEVVGLLTGTHTQGQAIAFAVPAELVAATLPTLREGKNLTRAFLGLRVSDEDDGVIVTSVIASGPADRAGLRPGDALSSFDGEPLSTPDDLYDRLDRLAGGATVSVRLRRDGELQVIDVELADWARQPTVIAGMTLRPAPGNGGEVVAVRPRSRADRAGVEVGDVVRTANGLPTQAPTDVKDALTGATSARLELVRDGASITLEL